MSRRQNLHAGSIPASESLAFKRGFQLSVESCSEVAAPVGEMETPARRPAIKKSGS